MRSNRSRSAVLKHCPRILRIGLNPGAEFSSELTGLADEIVRQQPARKRDVKAWLRDATERRSTDKGWRDKLDARHPAKTLVARLDNATTRHAAADELADCLVLMTASSDDHELAPRLARRLWHGVSQLADLRASFDSDGACLVSGDIFGQLLEEVDVDGPGMMIETVRGILVELMAEAMVLVVGMSALAAGFDQATRLCRSLRDLARQCGEKALLPIISTMCPPTVATFTSPGMPSDGVWTKPASDRAQRHSTSEIVVCPAVQRTKSSRDAIEPFKDAIGVALPLVGVPDLAVAHRSLARQFPYAEQAVGRVLTDLSTKRFVSFSPILLVGRSGAGKTTFVRALSEHLKVGLMRVDGANDSSSTFGGTERRWNSTEPCRPFMAVARFRQANPMVMVDEIDKAGTRQDYGRLWDAMLPFLDSETASRFQDPCLQVELDLRHVSITATANEITRLPGPLLDRFRVIEFPVPEACHLEALVPDILRSIASDQGCNPLFFEPLDQVEISFLTRRWRGGSIRPLRRAIEAILRARDRSATNRLH